MLSLALSTPAATRTLGRVLGQTLRPPALVLLRGDLGTGKTTLVRHVARAVGVSEPVVSPSFTIAQTYTGRRGVLVNHLDLYRLRAGDDVELFSWDDYLTPAALTFIEWPESGLDVLPPADVSIRLEHVARASRAARLWAADGLEGELERRLLALGLPVERRAGAAERDEHEVGYSAAGPRRDTERRP